MNAKDAVAFADEHLSVRVDSVNEVHRLEITGAVLSRVVLAYNDRLGRAE